MALRPEHTNYGPILTTGKSQIASDFFFLDAARESGCRQIAFAMLDLSDEEIDRAAVLELLIPHFRPHAEDQEEAQVLAVEFLDEQELRSGLVVARRHPDGRRDGTRERVPRRVPAPVLREVRRAQGA